MRIQYTIRTAIRSLRINTSRSLLTILGIVIGITAIIMVMSLGRGAEQLILGQIQAFGSKLISVVPGRQPQGPADFLVTLTDSLKQRELDLLSQKNNVPNVTTIMPAVYGSRSVSYRTETYQPTIFGVTEQYTSLYKVEPVKGRTFSEEEVRGYADVAVIGAEVAEELFADADPIGERIRVQGRNIRVIGILSKKGQSLVSFDKSVIMPYTTVQRYILGTRHFNEINLEVAEEDQIEETVGYIESTLRAAHNITNPEKDDFHIQTQAKAMETVSSITTALTFFLAAVAAISLVVGGIGIMNIMLVSVTERTREIGLRKALGATNRNIMSQFLLEAVMLTATGGVIGITLGALLSYAVTMVISRGFGLDWMFTIPLSSIVLGIGVSTGVGLVFGLYPARQAAKKSPIEALRYE